MPGTPVHWLALIALLIVLCFVLPFTWLTGVDAWYGSFLFWCLATLAVIALSFCITGRWKD